MSGNLACPLCRGQKGSHVTDTRQCADGIMRFRRCFDCHNLYRTVERADESERKFDTPVYFEDPKTSADENPTPSPTMSDDPTNDPRLLPTPTTKRKYTRRAPMKTE